MAYTAVAPVSSSIVSFLITDNVIITSKMLLIVVFALLASATSVEGYVGRQNAYGRCTHKLYSNSFKLGKDYLPEETLTRAAGGNMFEKVKLTNDPANVWTEVTEYAAAIRSGTIDWKDIASDDMDIRVKYAGMFHRKKATPGKFMMRLRVPNGILNSQQLRYFADAVEPYGPELGVVDITTRANIQLRGMPLEDAADIFKHLPTIGLTCAMSGLDNLRNMVGSPIAGIDPYEIYDTRALTKSIDDWYTGNGLGNPEWCNMPRKFNIAISGSRDDFAHTHINDIGLIPIHHSRTNQLGFNVVLGGYFSIKRIAGAIPMDCWIPEDEALDFCRAVLTLFRDFGSRKDRQKARLMWLIEEMGMDKFRQEVFALMSSYRGAMMINTQFEPAQQYTSEWTQGHRSLLGVHPQKQDNLNFIGVHIPVGRLSVSECRILADLADKYSDGEVRLTVEQNAIFPNIHTNQVSSFTEEPVFHEDGSRLSIYPGQISGQVVSCTGSQFCPLALVETKLTIDALTRKLDELVTIPNPVRIHMTGCPNSCGQVQLADIGLMGAPAKKMNAEGVMKAVPGVNVFVGGKIGEDAMLAEKPMMTGIPLTEEDLIPVLTKILVDTFHGQLKQ